MTSQLRGPVPTAVLVTMLLPTGCSLFPRSHDYAFSVSGVVLNEAGAGLPQVEVTLEVQGSVFEVIEPVRTRTIVTGDSGAFHFMYISHQRAVPYSLSFAKEGYKPQHLTGAAPPDAGYELVMIPIQRSPRVRAGTLRPTGHLAQSLRAAVATNPAQAAPAAGGRGPRASLAFPLPGCFRERRRRAGPTLDARFILHTARSCVRICVRGDPVATNLAIDDRLLSEALRMGGHRTKRETVNEALQEYIQRRKRKSFAKLFGKIDFRPDWDYKKARRRT